jgi:hypothetical protein
MSTSTTWQETLAPDEDTRFELYAKRLVQMQAAAGGKHRALHAKAHGVYSAKLEIGNDVPADLRHGIAAKPATYEALVRYSNGAGRIQKDKVGDVRGIAVKVLGVEGVKVLGSGTTQDFLGILTSALPFANAADFMDTVWAIRSKALALFRLIGTFGPIKPFKILGTVMKSMKAPPASLATKKFFSSVPIQWGPHAARFALVPVDNLASELGHGEDLFREELASRIAREPVVYALQVQLFVDAASTPIEDASVDWPSPYVTVGKLTIGKQDAESERGRMLRDRGEKLAFDPWHALVAHKPLGNIMRARKVAYYASTEARGTIPDPASVAALLV